MSYDQGFVMLVDTIILLVVPLSIEFTLISGGVLDCSESFSANFLVLKPSR
ncbi:hypothetical protein MUP77_06620 [Candidatus Bathyarchaeota archaeon]|nr:hypothetical protein [Candidatus Bathyarchaeota archaeon]